MKKYLLYILLFFTILFLIYFLLFINNKKNTVENNNFSTGFVNEIPNEEVQNKIEKLDNDINLNQDNQDNIDESYETNQVKLETKELEIDIDLINKVGKNGEIDLCNDINDQLLKNQCLDNGYALKASVEKSVYFCTKINDDLVKNKCLDNYYYNFSISNSNYEFCTKIQDSNLQNKCNYTIILPIVEDLSYSGDNKICSLLKDEKKDYCISVINKNIEKNTQEKEINFNNIDDCKNIEDLNIQNTCYDNFYYKDAIEKSDKLLCDKIKNNTKKEDCLGDFIKLSDREILNQAIEKNDVELCDLIKDENIFNNCFDTFTFKKAIKNKNSDLCLEITNKGLKKQCIEFLAN